MAMIKFGVCDNGAGFLFSTEKMGPFGITYLIMKLTNFLLWSNILLSFQVIFLIGELKTYDAHSHYKIFSSHVIRPGFF